MVDVAAAGAHKQGHRRNPRQPRHNEGMPRRCRRHLPDSRLGKLDNLHRLHRLNREVRMRREVVNNLRLLQPIQSYSFTR